MVENVSNIVGLSIYLQELIQHQDTLLCKKKALLDLKNKEKEILISQMHNVNTHKGNIVSNSYANREFKEQLEDIINEDVNVNSKYSLWWQSLSDAIKDRTDFVTRNSNLVPGSRVTVPPPDSQFYPDSFYIKGGGVSRGPRGTNPNWYKEHYHSYDDVAKSGKLDKTVKIVKKTDPSIEVPKQGIKEQIESTQLPKGLKVEVNNEHRRLNKVPRNQGDEKANINAVNHKKIPPPIKDEAIKSVSNVTTTNSAGVNRLRKKVVRITREKKSLGEANAEQKLPKQKFSINKFNQPKKGIPNKALSHAVNIFKDILRKRKPEPIFKETHTPYPRTFIAFRPYTSRVLRSPRVLIKPKSALLLQQKIPETASQHIQPIVNIKKIPIKSLKIPNKKTINNKKKQKHSNKKHKVPKKLNMHNKILTDFITHSHSKKNQNQTKKPRAIIILRKTKVNPRKICLKKLKLKPVKIAIRKHPKIIQLKLKRKTIGQTLQKRLEVFKKRKTELQKVLIHQNLLKVKYNSTSDGTIRGKITKSILKTLVHEAKLRYSLVTSIRIVERLLNQALESKRELIKGKEKITKIVFSLAYQKIGSLLKELKREKAKSHNSRKQVKLVKSIRRLKLVLRYLASKRQALHRLSKVLDKKIIVRSRFLEKVKKNKKKTIVKSIDEADKTIRKLKAKLTNAVGLIQITHKRIAKANKQRTTLKFEPEAKKKLHKYYFTPLLGVLKKRFQLYLGIAKATIKRLREEILKGKILLNQAKREGWYKPNEKGIPTVKSVKTPQINSQQNTSKNTSDKVSISDTTNKLRKLAKVKFLVLSSLGKLKDNIKKQKFKKLLYKLSKKMQILRNQKEKIIKGKVKSSNIKSKSKTAKVVKSVKAAKTTKRRGKFSDKLLPLIKLLVRNSKKIVNLHLNNYLTTKKTPPSSEFLEYTMKNMEKTIPNEIDYLLSKFTKLELLKTMILLIKNTRRNLNSISKVNNTTRRIKNTKNLAFLMVVTYNEISIFLMIESKLDNKSISNDIQSQMKESVRNYTRELEKAINIPSSRFKYAYMSREVNSLKLTKLEEKIKQLNITRKIIHQAAYSLSKNEKKKAQKELIKTNRKVIKLKQEIKNIKAKEGLKTKGKAKQKGKTPSASSASDLVKIINPANKTKLIIAHAKKEISQMKLKEKVRSLKILTKDLGENTEILNISKMSKPKEKSLKESKKLAKKAIIQKIVINLLNKSIGNSIQKNIIKVINSKSKNQNNHSVKKEAKENIGKIKIALEAVSKAKEAAKKSEKATKNNI